MTLMKSVMDICFVDLKTAQLGIAVIVVIAIQHICCHMLANAAGEVAALLERDTVTLISSVLEIWFVEQTTALLGILAWIAVPPLPASLLAWSYSGWGTTPQWTAATGLRGFQCQVSLSVTTDGNNAAEWRVGG